MIFLFHPAALKLGGKLDVVTYDDDMEGSHRNLYSII